MVQVIKRNRSILSRDKSTATVGNTNSGASTSNFAVANTLGSVGLDDDDILDVTFNGNAKAPAKPEIPQELDVEVFNGDAPESVTEAPRRTFDYHKLESPTIKGYVERYTGKTVEELRATDGELADAAEKDWKLVRELKLLGATNAVSLGMFTTLPIPVKIRGTRPEGPINPATERGMPNQSMEGTPEGVLWGRVVQVWLRVQTNVSKPNIRLKYGSKALLMLTTAHLAYCAMYGRTWGGRRACFTAKADCYTVLDLMTGLTNKYALLIVEDCESVLKLLDEISQFGSNLRNY